MQSLFRPPVASTSRITKRHSHIGRSLLQIPAGVELRLAPVVHSATTYISNPFLKNANRLTVRGPKGSLRVTLPDFVKLEPPLAEKPPVVALSVQDSSIKAQRTMWGTMRVLIANAIQGVHAGHEATIDMVGVGYRAALEPHPKLEKRQQLSIKLGYPNPVIKVVPQGITAEVPSPTSIVLRGANKQKLGEFAAIIRRHRPPEPFNGKGIFVNGETIKRKEVKKK